MAYFSKHRTDHFPFRIFWQIADVIKKLRKAEFKKLSTKVNRGKVKSTLPDIQTSFAVNTHLAYIVASWSSVIE